MAEAIKECQRRRRRAHSLIEELYVEDSRDRDESWEEK